MTPTDDEINVHIGAWMADKRGRQLYEALGWSWQEYRKYIDRNLIPDRPLPALPATPSAPAEPSMEP